MHGYIFIRLLKPTQWVSQSNPTEHESAAALINHSLSVNSENDGSAVKKASVRMDTTLKTSPP